MPDTHQLACAPAFQRLGGADLRAVLDLALVTRLSAGQAMFDEGQQLRRFHLLVSGHMRFVRLTAEGDAVIVLHIAAGQMFGIGVAFGQVTHHNSALAAGDCLVLSWRSALWPSFCADYDGFAAETLRSLGARADEMSNRIVELSTKLVEQRIACALLRMIAQSGRKVAGGVEIGFPITRQNIADMTGATLHTVSRTLCGWERQGLVESTRRHIVVRDPHRLMTMSGDAGRVAGAEAVAAEVPHLRYASAAAAAARSSARKAHSSRPYATQASVTV